jgi:hypothetical protein
MTRLRLARVRAKAVALATPSLVASALVASALVVSALVVSVVLSFGAGPAQAAPEWHAGAAASWVDRTSAAEATPLAAPASSSSKTTKPFPVGFIIGGVLVIVGFAGGVYGQMLRRRGRRPPGS